MHGYCGYRFILVLFLVVSAAVAEEEGDSEEFAPVIESPAFQAEVSGGFNYDLLRNPLNVSFEQPRGYLALNMPFRFVAPDNMMSQMSEGVSDFLAEDGEPFEPKASASQHTNTSFLVDVPMFGGVASFASTQNMYLRYENILGAPEMTIPVESENMDLFLRGATNVPLTLTMGWESMSFGYAFRAGEKLRFACNLHRHTFHFDLRAKVGVDLLGNLTVKVPEGDEESNPLGAQRAQTVNYSSDQMYGNAEGTYSVAVWSPTVAVKYSRISLVSRFGVDTKAEGKLNAAYSLPIFLTRDFQTEDEDFFLDNQERIRNNETHSFHYATDEDLGWKLPSGHTLAFDIVKEKLSLSYTKLFGDIEMNLPNIVETIVSDQSGEGQRDTVDFDVGVTVDHVLLISGGFNHAFFNLGIFGMDFRFGDEENLLEKIEALPNFGGGTMLPILTFGTTMGSKMRLLLEVDLLPLSAVKTGIVYHF
ncbi:MAG: hypothetical protein GF344_13010 [Chitinivibrionales bacterium]|nr:hypothetical protein [Chitinivibrionales bacterium]MBD3357655.1 hypothetical protein [Chitinivibrionales bacterium]